MTTFFEQHFRVSEKADNKPSGSSTFNLSETAITAHRALGDVVTDGVSVVALAEEVDGDNNATGAWEIFEGVYTAGTPDTLSRVTRIDSSTGAWIDWSATGVDSIPLITMVDRVAGLNRVVAVWDHAVEGDSTNIDFDYDFVAGRKYILHFEGLMFDGSGISERLRMRFKRGGVVDSGSTDYTNSQMGRHHTNWGVNQGDGNIIGVHVNTFAGSAWTNWTYSQLLHGRIDLIRLGDAEAASAISHTNSPSSVSPYSPGIHVGTGRHNQEAVVDGIQLFSNQGSDFDRGKITMLEIF